MTIHVSHMPIWASILLIGSFFYAIVFIATPVKRAALDAGMTPKQATNVQLGIIGFYLLYLAYVSVLALKGQFDVNSLPPKVMVWAGLPLLLILFGFIGNTHLYKTLLRSITLEALIKVHIFRLLGVFFILLYSYRLLPASFAFAAGLGDIITALFAWPVARMVANKHPWRRVAVYVWSIFGIMDVIDLLVIAIIIGANGNLREMTVFPFVWFPAFAPATLLFMHAAIFRKLTRQMQ